MYEFDFKLDVDSSEINDQLFKETNKYLDKSLGEMKDKLFDHVSKDLESFMYERFDNVQRRYFNQVAGFLLDKDMGKPPHDVRIKLSEWLRGLGYDQESFRKKIYEDNKEEIVEMVKNDAAYEVVQNMFSTSYFKHWTFGDISTNYPQSQVIRGFLNVLAKQPRFQEELGKVLDRENQDKVERLNNLKSEINKAKELLDSLDLD